LTDDERRAIAALTLTAGRRIMTANPNKIYAQRNKIMKKTEYKSFASSDETRAFSHGKVEILNIGEGTVGRLTLEPGWRWSQDVKPLAGTELCEAPHFQYQVAGRLGVKMADGTEFELKEGDVSCLPSGHDAWVIGDEPVVLIDFFGATDYAKSQSAAAQ
jgi:hypothetical protein